jgi:hypothetical protein
MDDTVPSRAAILWAHLKAMWYDIHKWVPHGYFDGGRARGAAQASALRRVTAGTLRRSSVIRGCDRRPLSVCRLKQLYSWKPGRL